MSDERTPSQPDREPSASSVADLAEAFRGTWAAIQRRRREFVIVFLTVAIGVQVVSFLWPGVYVARAALLIQNNRYATGFDAATERLPTVVSAGVSEEDVRSETAILTSEEVLRATLETLGLDQATPPWYTRVVLAPVWAYDHLFALLHGMPPPTRADRALRNLRSSIEAERIKDSNVLVVTYRSGHPAFAQMVLQELIDRYLTHHVEVHRRTDMERFFRDQARELESELAESEEALQALKARIGVTDLEAEQDLQLGVHAELRQEAWELERTLAELGERIASYETTLIEQPEQVQTSTTAMRNDLVLQELKEQALQLELERIQLLGRYNADSPLVRENQEKLQTARHAIAGERIDGVARSVMGLSPALVQVGLELARARAKRAGTQQRLVRLNAQIETSRAHLRMLDEKSLEATRIQRVISTTETQLLRYLRRGVEARINDALDEGRFTNASLIQQAAADRRPVRPRKLISLGLSLIGGLIAGLAAVLALEVRESGLTTLLSSLAPRPEERT